MIIQAKEEHFEEKGMLVKGKKKAKLEARFMTSMCRYVEHKSTCKFINLQTCKLANLQTCKLANHPLPGKFLQELQGKVTRT